MTPRVPFLVLSCNTYCYYQQRINTHPVILESFYQSKRLHVTGLYTETT